MLAVIQRVSEAGVKIPKENYTAFIRDGLLILIAVKKGDSRADAEFTAAKCCNLRIFNDTEGKMNLSVKDVNGEALIISQFTLYGETAKGNRPGYINAAGPDEAIPLYEHFILKMKEGLGDSKIKTGIFGADMKVSLINDGPVTVMVESKK